MNGFDKLTTGKEFGKAFKELNAQQKKAVEQIDGPILVIAGPGTGKTQLIGTRVGYILDNQDIEPSNILLLTFTDSAVAEMRRRLERLIPTKAHRVNIYTYHGFANDLIRNNLEYFEGLENEPIDELAVSTILSTVLDGLPYSHFLKAGQYYKKQILGFISDAKRALLSPDEITAVAKANRGFIKEANNLLRRHLGKIDRISQKSVSIFETLLATSNKQLVTSSTKPPKAIRPLEEYFKEALEQALEEVAASGKTTALTRWKNKWLEKDEQGRFIIAGKRQNDRLEAAADIYGQYQKRLANERIYDYDDMIIRVIEVLEKNPDFKFTLAEHYQYIMLDEFQDTNPAQLRLIELLTDHPVHEGRPNVLAVGDDDQAIYAFQGADHANMKHFAQMYHDVKIISLKQNYRSHQDLVNMATAISVQIETRLHHSFPGIEKILVAAGTATKRSPKLQAREFISDTAQYGWVAGEISRLVKNGMPANEIAVLAPQHKYLERLLPFLARQKIAVAYEKREDVLEEPQVLMLSQMARLVLALAEGNEGLSDHLWAEVISYDFWGVPTEDIWRIVWAGWKSKPLTSLLMQNPKTKLITQFILRLKDLSTVASLEEILDALIGIGDMHKQLKLPLRSPFYEHYFGPKAIKQNPHDFTNLLSSLNLVRTRLRNRQRRVRETTHLIDFVSFIDENQEADINILNTSPYHQSQDAVNLLTAHGAKGREFKAVFVLAANAEVWGHASRVRSSAVKLPANLKYITYSGMSDDERLRLFYVAITRAKSNLYLISYQQTLDGQRQNHLEFLGISRGENEQLTSSVLPAKYASLILDDSDHVQTEAMEDYWSARHLPSFKPNLRELLSTQLEKYKLSATGLNYFVDLENYGPQYFFIYNLLGFRQAPSPTSAFGIAMHDTLSWTGNQLSKWGKLPARKTVLAHFEAKLAGGWLRQQEHKLLRQRGRASLPIWLAQKGPELSAGDKFEKNFSSEGVVLGAARLTGKIDRLLIDSKTRRITVVDIKTGAAFSKWPSSVKAHKFKQQLMFYKLLVENSSSFKGYSVNRGLIEFAEPDNGKIVSLPYDFKEEEVEQLKNLTATIWQRIQKLDLPDITKYPSSLKGIKQFEKDLS